MRERYSVQTVGRRRCAFLSDSSDRFGRGRQGRPLKNDQTRGESSPGRLHLIDDVVGKLLYG